MARAHAHRRSRAPPSPSPATRLRTQAIPISAPRHHPSRREVSQGSLRCACAVCPPYPPTEATTPNMHVQDKQAARNTQQGERYKARVFEPPPARRDVEDGGGGREKRLRKAAGLRGRRVAPGAAHRGGSTKMSIPRSSSCACEARAASVALALCRSAYCSRAAREGDEGRSSSSTIAVVGSVDGVGPGVTAAEAAVSTAVAPAAR